MVDVRNLDPPEEQLIRATDVVIAAPATGFPGVDLAEAVARLAERCDLLYLHIDSDILDERYVPNHRTREPNGPSMEQVQAAIDTVMATGKVAALRRGLGVWRRPGQRDQRRFRDRAGPRRPPVVAPLWHAGLNPAVAPRMPLLPSAALRLAQEPWYLTTLPRSVFALYKRKNRTRLK